MCGRYTNTADFDELNKRFNAPNLLSTAFTRSFNIAPEEEVLAIVRRDGERQARMLRWGLVPSWSRSLESATKMINARVETVASKPSFRDLIPSASRRALQVADGFFEWLKPEHGHGRSQPFYFQVDGGVPFAFASLWTPAKVQGRYIESVTMLTCDSAPNPLVARVHHRMPVILADPEAQAAWLDPSLGTKDVLKFCRAIPASRTSARAVSPALNKPDRVRTVRQARRRSHASA
jgi:putative SOS response-associated peptidase YedK